MQFVFEERSAKFFLDQTFALGGVLPIRETDLFNDVVNIGDDALDDDMDVLVFGILEQLRQRLFGFVPLLLWRERAGKASLK